MNAERYVTPAELRIIRAIAEHGRIETAAYEIGISAQTAKNLLYDARHRMGVRANCQLTYLLGCGEFDR